MNFRIVLKSLGIVLTCEAIFMIPSLLVALLSRGNDHWAFVLSIFILVLVSIPLLLIKPINHHIYPRDGFAIVALGWLFISLFGALPFYISGAIPVATDALFESISGFTTTGASILGNIEALPKGILFWRSSTHWIGGMGVLMLALAILPSVGAKSLNIMKAESPGPSIDKIVPKIGHTAKILYSIYISITAVEIILLRIAGMPLFDSFIHAFGTAGTGGFSNMNASVGAYNSIYIEGIIAVFMILFGINFALYYQVLSRNFKSVLKNEELRLYLGLISVSIVFTTLNLYGSKIAPFWQAFRVSSFQVASIITTTGYSSTDFDLWPVFSKMILVVLMVIGASAGSTGGGMKISRILVLIKAAWREILRIIHPRSIYTVKMNGKVIEEETLLGIISFFFLYIAIVVTSIFIISLDRNDFETAVSAVVASIGNIGPGLGAVGPTGNYSDLSAISKMLLSLCMITGRLEIFPILLLFAPSFWKKVNI